MPYFLSSVLPGLIDGASIQSLYWSLCSNTLSIVLEESDESSTSHPLAKHAKECHDADIKLTESGGADNDEAQCELQYFLALVQALVAGEKEWFRKDMYKFLLLPKYGDPVRSGIPDQSSCNDGAMDGGLDGEEEAGVVAHGGVQVDEDVFFSRVCTRSIFVIHMMHVKSGFIMNCHFGFNHRHVHGSCLRFSGQDRGNDRGVETPPGCCCSRGARRHIYELPVETCRPPG